jgi:hypothetical protein
MTSTSPPRRPTPQTLSWSNSYNRMGTSSSESFAHLDAAHRQFPRRYQRWFALPSGLGFSFAAVPRHMSMLSTAFLKLLFERQVDHISRSLTW